MNSLKQQPQRYYNAIICFLQSGAGWPQKCNFVQHTWNRDQCSNLRGQGPTTLTTVARKVY